MGTSTDEIRREAAATREDLDAKIDLLRHRARATANRLRPLAPALAGCAVAVLVGVYLIHRSRRRPSMRERIAAMVPDRLWRFRDATQQQFGRGIPPIRIEIGDRRAGDEPRTSGWQKIGLRLAQSAGTAAGSALVAFALRSLLKPEKGAGH